jgi:hypothetical protein
MLPGTTTRPPSIMKVGIMRKLRTMPTPQEGTHSTPENMPNRLARLTQKNTARSKDTSRGGRLPAR